MRSRKHPHHVSISIGVVIASGAWGVYWLPQRALFDAGMTGAWATIAQFGLCLAIFSPVALYRKIKGLPVGFDQPSVGLLIGGGIVCYSNAFLLTDVVRVLVFFYLTPVWATLFELAFLKIRPGLARAASLGLGLCGAWVVLGGEGGLPLPQNLGDWLAVASGIMMAAGAARSHSIQPEGMFSLQWAYFFYGSVVAVAQIPLLSDVLGPAPMLDAWIHSLPLLLPLAFLFLIPSNAMLILSPSRIGAGLFSILILSELVIGAISAALFADEPFGWREAIGCSLIVLAGLTEVFLARGAFSHSPRAPILPDTKTP
ncbi:MAG: DMT family transporter [Alphaproteobacteria bacterium]